MAKFTIDITGAAKLKGITAAREAYNEALPEQRTEPDEDGKTDLIVPKPGTLETDDEYVQHVMENAAASYAQQHGTDVVAIDAKISELEDQKARISGAGLRGKRKR